MPYVAFGKSAAGSMFYYSKIPAVLFSADTHLMKRLPVEHPELKVGLILNGYRVCFSKNSVLGVASLS